MTTTVEVECACCGGVGLHEGRALCHACYHWHRTNGTLHKYPLLRTWLETLVRIDEFAELRRCGLSIRRAAAELGVTKTLRRTLRAAAESPPGGRLVSAVHEWIRPWYPSGLVGHISRDCPDLLKWVSEPQEGAGWLDPRADASARSRGYFTNTRTCPGCLTRYDPKLAAELGATDD